MGDAGTAVRLATVEARWFGSGPVPGALAGWFERGGDVIREPPRTDRYLRLFGVTAVGVKLRAGRLEIKARREGEAATVRWAGRDSPRERWLKWSAPLGELAADPVPPLDVSKRRRLLARPGVQVELAELEFAGAAFWSFGLEAETAAALDAVLASAWAGSAPACAPNAGCGYPAWLDRVVAG